MIGRIVFFIPFCKYVIGDDSAMSLEAALIRANGSIENILPFAIGSDFSKLGKKLKLSRELSARDHSELLRLEVRLDQLKKRVLTATPDMQDRLENSTLLEKVEKPLLMKWKKMLDFLKSPKRSDWNKLVEDCQLENARIFMKRMELNIKNSETEMANEIQSGQLNESIMHGIRRAVAGRMLLMISLVHLCGGAVHGGNFDEVSDEDVLYLKNLQSSIMQRLQIESIRNKVRVKKPAEMVSGRPYQSNQSHLVESAGFFTNVMSRLMKERKRPTAVDIVQHSPLPEPPVSTSELLTGMIPKILVTYVVNAAKAGEYLPSPVGEMMGALGSVLTSFDTIQRLDHFDDTNDILEEIGEVKEQLVEITTQLIALEETIKTGNLAVIERMNKLNLVKEVRDPLDLLLGYMNTLSRHRTKASLRRVYQQCEDDVPRKLMSKMFTYTKEDAETIGDAIKTLNFDENYVAQWREKHNNLMQIIMLMHSFCRGMLQGEKFNHKTDVEVAYVRELFYKTRAVMKNISNWRRDNFFTHPDGVDDVIRKRSAKVDTTKGYNHSVLSNATRDDLQRLYPSYEWIVLVYSGKSAVGRHHNHYPNLKCFPEASRHVTISDNRNVFVVRTRKYDNECKNGCFNEHPRTTTDWFLKKATCPIYILFNWTDCKHWTEPKIVFPHYSCHVLVEDTKRVGISGTPRSHSTLSFRNIFIFPQKT